MKLRIAIQKSGRLSDGSIELLRKCGIRFSNGMGKLRAETTDFPLEIFFLRVDDIPDYVADGVAHAGIVGENVLAERLLDLKVAAKLGFGRCRLSLALPRTSSYSGINDLINCRIATSHPFILNEYLNERNIYAEVHAISGSVEIAPSIGLADAVCDIVSSGSTLFSNGLREVETIMRSEAVLIRGTQMDGNTEELLDRLLFRIHSVIAAAQNKYILLNAPEANINKIRALLPGMRSPSIIPLADRGWVSVHSVIAEKDYWEVVDQLKRAGAEGILVLPIDQMFN